MNHKIFLDTVQCLFFLPNKTCFPLLRKPPTYTEPSFQGMLDPVLSPKMWVLSSMEKLQEAETFFLMGLLKNIIWF